MSWIKCWHSNYHADNSRGSKAFSGVCVCVCVCDSVHLRVCLHDKTKTAETRITKFGKGIVHYGPRPPINIKWKGRRSRSQEHKVQASYYDIDYVWAKLQPVHTLKPRLYQGNMQHVAYCRQHVAWSNMLQATSSMLPATKLLPVCCLSVAGYKGIHVAEIQATCCRATCCSGVNAALQETTLFF